jgi:phage gp29-like protein
MAGTNVFEGYSQGALYYQHPDELVAQKGIEIYRQMQDRDDMVATAYAYLEMAALSTGWQMDPASDDPQDVLAADFATHTLENLRGGPTQSLRWIMDAIPIGFSVCEKIWGDIAGAGDFAGKQGFTRIIHRNPEHIFFRLDDHGDIRAEDGIWQEGAIGSPGGIALPVDDVVYWAFDPKDDNPYGRTPSRRAHRWWFIKDGTARLWARYMERYGIPVPIAKFSPNAGEDARTKMMKWLKEFRTTLTGAFPSDWSIDFLKNDHSDQTNLFSEALLACNRSIARAIMLPALVVEQQGTGAYALGKEHNDQFIWILNYIRAGVEEVVNRQIIAPLCIWNFGANVPPPRFRFKPYNEEDLAAKAQMCKTVSDTGVPIPLPWMYETFSIPVPADDDETTQKANPTPPQLQPFTGEKQKPGVQEKPPTPEELAGISEKDKQQIAEMAWEAANGKLRTERTFVRMGKMRDKSASEELIDFDAAAREEDADVAFAAENLAIIFESAAQEVGAQAGKGNGGRPSK